MSAAKGRGRIATSTRFRSRYDLRGLVDVVAAVAQVAAPAAPERVTQRQWDATRAQAGYGDAPSARQVAKRLGMPWAELLALALGGRDVDKVLGHRFGVKEDNLLGAADVRTALRTVALRLHQRTLTTKDYADESARMLAAARRHWRHGSGLYLPNVNQIERVAGSWDAALALAELEERPAQDRPAGLLVVDALELALEAFGCLLTRLELDRFATANGLSVAKFEKGRPWANYVAELRTRRDEWGKWTPPSTPPFASRVDYAVSVPLPPDVPRRKKRRWSREECVAALAQVLAELGPGERLTQRVYQRLSAGRPELPALGSLQRHGKFTEMVAEARRLAATGNGAQR